MLLDARGEIVIELLCDIARKLQMLFLVFTDRHMRRAIDQNIGRHERGIGVETDGRVLAILAGLLLELRHAVEPAQTRYAIKDPGELGMFRDLALVENDMLFGIDSGRDKRRRDLANAGRQLVGVLRHGDRMQVDDAVDALVRLLQLDEPRNCAEIVTKMQISGRLDAGENALMERAYGGGHRGSNGRSALCQQAQAGTSRREWRRSRWRDPANQFGN